MAGTSRGVAECRFCGDDTKLTKEHAWSDWALKLVREVGGEPVHRVWAATADGDAVIRGVGPKPDLQVRVMCSACNTERLSSLEGQMSAVLRPLILGRSTTIRRQELEPIARWTVKTAMVFEFIEGGPSEPFFTAEERRALVMPQSIPDGITVSVARYGDDRPTAFSGGMYLNGPPEAPTDWGALWFTFSLRQLIVQVYAGGDRIYHVDMPWWQPEYVKRIWPAETNLI